MSKLRPSRAGLVVAALMASFHAAWVLLVATGWAQRLIDFIFRLHFIKPVYVIDEFNAGTAVGLILYTSAVGYLMGWLFGVLWNRLHGE